MCVFSIIVPVYNVEHYLAECLDSVFEQIYSSYEVICINDGSTDGSAAILADYVDRYKQLRIITQHNRGLSAARNAGIRTAKGEYLFFLDSDDWLEQDALQILANHLSGEDMICFNGRRYFEDGTTEDPDPGLAEATMSGWDYYNKYALQTRKFHFVCTVLRLYKREFLQKNQLFFKEGIYHEDNLFTPIACFYAKQIKVIPDVLYIYRIRAGSIMQSYNPRRFKDIILVANELSVFFDDKIAINKEILYKEIAGEYFSPFLPDNKHKYDMNEFDLIRLINWQSYKRASLYARHRRLYYLLRISPAVFRFYIYAEEILKSFIRRK